MLKSRFVLFASMAIGSLLFEAQWAFAKCRCTVDDIPKKGFVWDASASRGGVVTLVVSLETKTLRIYQGVEPIGIARIKARAGDNVPRGVFELTTDVKGARSGAPPGEAFRWRVRPLFDQSTDVNLDRGLSIPIEMPVDFAQDVAKISKTGALVVVIDDHANTERVQTSWPMEDLPLQVASVGSLGDTLMRLRDVEVDRIREFARIAMPTAQSLSPEVSLVVAHYDRNATPVRGRRTAWSVPVALTGENDLEGTYVYVLADARDREQTPEWLAFQSAASHGSQFRGQNKFLDVLERVRIKGGARFREASLSLDKGSVLVVTDAFGRSESGFGGEREFAVLGAYPPVPVQKGKIPKGASKRKKGPQYASYRRKRSHRRSKRRYRRRTRKYASYEYYRTDRPLFRPEMMIGL